LFNSSIGYLCDGVNRLIENNDMLKILQKEVSDVRRVEIIKLITHYEENIAPVKPKKRGTIAGEVRNAFKQVNGALLDGGTVKDALKTFKTSLKDDAQDSRPILSESPDPYYLDKDEELAGSISKLRFNSIDELNKKVVRHLKKRTNRYEEVWWSAVKDYLEKRKKIKDIGNQAPSEAVEKILVEDWLSLYPKRKSEITADLTDQEKLRLNFELVRKYELHKKGPVFLEENINTFELTNANSIKRTDKVYGLYSASTELSYYMADIYIPAYVLYCMRCLLQSWYGFNAHTAQNLRLIDVDYLKSDPRKIIITPNKSKTGDDQEAEIKYQKSSRECRVISLLIENSENIASSGFDTKTDSLFQSLSKIDNGRYLFRPLIGQTNKQKVLSNSNLPHYTDEQIRDQHIVMILAETGNAWEAMRVAGHKTLQTLIKYSDQRIMRIANEANINEFMKRLETTIVWAVNGEESAVERMGMSIDDVDEALLFPVTEYGYEEDIPEVDSWISSTNNHDLKIPITMMRIEWCLRQHYYYAVNWKILAESNPERFRKIHLPRVLFTIALKKVIMEKRPTYYGKAIKNLPEHIGNKIDR